MSKMHLVDWIWSARGSIALDPPLRAQEVFERLDPMLDAAGVTQDIEGRQLSYVKDNPAAQDKLATFSSGTLTVDEAQPRLLYDLKSPALRLVFLAPLLFLAIAQGMTLLSDYERAKQEQEEAAKADEEEEEEEDKEEQPMNAIDAFLGAPEPLSLEERKKMEEEKGEEDKHSAKPAYAFAGIFAVLWLFGRLFEPWLLRRRLREALYPEAGEADAADGKADGSQPT